MLISGGSWAVLLGDFGGPGCGMIIIHRNDYKRFQSKTEAPGVHGHAMPVPNLVDIELVLSFGHTNQRERM